MNPAKILTGSLALNLVLAASAAYIFQKSAAPVVVEKTAIVPEKIKAPLPKTETAKEPALPFHEIETVSETIPAGEFAWRDLEAKDFKIYIANLRAVNCPEETIRDIITGDVNKFYAKRIRGLRPEYKYWQTRQDFSSAKNYELQRQIRAIEKEKSALLVELLGVDPNQELKNERRSFDYWERTVQFLPEDKRDAALEIQSKYVQQEQEFHSGGMLDDEDQKKLRELYKKRMDELATILTPQELNEYDLRASSVANQLRHDLEVFKPSENEFRQIFEIRKAREEDLAAVYDPDDKAGRERRDKAVKETDKQIKALIGDDRFALYKRGQDWDYRQLIGIVERMEVPRENADQVYEMKKTVEVAAAKIRSNKELTSAQRAEELKKLREDAEKNITDTLGGEKGWKKYERQGGWWLNNISAKKRP